MLQNETITNRRMIFIAGLHRSGTSILHRTLRRHPAISGFHDTGVPEDEGQHLQSVYPTGAAFGGPGRFGFDPAAHMDEHHSLANADNAKKLFVQWQRHWDLTRPCLLEKSPPNLIRMRFLQRLFPNSSFIVLFRHPVAAAYATQKWSKTSIPELLDHTLLCYERALGDLPRLERAFVMRYEDFVAHPRATLNNLVHWLGLQPLGIEEEVRGSLNEDYFRLWRKDHGSLLRRWRLGLGRSVKGYDARSRTLGYSLLGKTLIHPFHGAGAYRLGVPAFEMS